AAAVDLDQDGVRGGGLVAALARLRSRYWVGGSSGAADGASDNGGRAPPCEQGPRQCTNHANVHDNGKPRVAKVHAPLPARHLLSKFHPRESMLAGAARCRVT